MMRRALAVCSMLVAVAGAPAHAADVMVPAARPYLAAPVIAPGGVTGCWFNGLHGWGWYPCYEGPPAYWHAYRYGWRPYWARHHSYRQWGYW